MQEGDMVYLHFLTPGFAEPGSVIPCGKFVKDGDRLAIHLDRFPMVDSRGEPLERAHFIPAWDGKIHFGSPKRYVSLPGPVVNSPRRYYEVDDNAKTYRRLTNEDVMKLMGGYSLFMQTNGPLKPDYKVI